MCLIRKDDDMLEIEDALILMFLAVIYLFLLIYERYLLSNICYLVVLYFLRILLKLEL